MRATIVEQMSVQGAAQNRVNYARLQDHGIRRAQLREQEHKCMAYQSISYVPDATYERMMRSRVRVPLTVMRCVHCNAEYMPTFYGEQVCTSCKSR